MAATRQSPHDWASDAYVDEWVQRQQPEDARRAERFQLMCDLFPFPRDATVIILDVGAGYGPVSKFILDRYPHATCIAQDGSEPMLRRARTLMESYRERVSIHRSDLFDRNWIPVKPDAFDAAVSSSCLHNLQDFTRISEIYREIRARLKPGGVFLNVDLVNAPTAELGRRYVDATAARREREGAPPQSIEAMVREGRSSLAKTPGPFPATLDEQLQALNAAGFREVDCFWKDLRRALFGGYV